MGEEFSRLTLSSENQFLLDPNLKGKSGKKLNLVHAFGKANLGLPLGEF